MISYELLKQCKDMGFPFNPHRDWEKSDFAWLPSIEITKADREKLWIPTLEEAIEACGDGIFNLLRQSDWHQQETGFNWLATFGNVTDMKSLSVSEIERVMIKAGGSTPLEAVLNLWLAIHGRT